MEPWGQSGAEYGFEANIGEPARRQQLFKRKVRIWHANRDFEADKWVFG